MLAHGAARATPGCSAHVTENRLAQMACAAFLLMAVLGGCTSPPPAQPAATPSLYERLGGRPAIAAVVDDAVRNIAADPRINQRFAKANPNHLQGSLIDLLCERSGGPCVYKGRNMADTHDGMQIRDEEFDALLDDIAQAMDKRRVPAPERRESLAILGQMRGAIVGH